jgi:organic hydroperoxide reductase OsmC/OhrA
VSDHVATISWKREGAPFTDKKYSRSHEWTFDGGVTVPGSSSPASVPVPYSEPAAVDPEEAFIASLSSCHMLWFLAIAAKRGFVVDSYTDAASGTLARDASGKTWMTRVTLRPRVAFNGPQPSREEFDNVHHQAHEECYIATSVKSEIVCEPEIIS